MPCGQLGIGLKKDEAKPNPRYPSGSTASRLQMMRRTMSDAITGQKARYVVNVDKSEFMLRKKPGNGLTEDEGKLNTRYPLGLRVSRLQALRKTTYDALKKMRSVAKEAVEKYVMKKTKGKPNEPSSTLCEQRRTKMTKDEVKTDTRYPAGPMVSRSQAPRKTMSDAIAGQEARYVVDVDKSKSMLRKQPGNS